MSLSALAEIGQFLLTRLDVTIIRDGKSIAAKKLDKIQAQDVIVTGKKSLAVVKLNDATVIKINESSQLSLNHLFTDKNPTQIGLSKGSAFFKANKDAKSKTKLVIKTRTASLGVRGTTFFAAVATQKNATDTWMCVQEGVVIATSLNTKESKKVLAGQGVKISDTTKLQDPRFLPWTKGLNWEFSNGDTTNVDIENKLDIRDAYEDILDTDYE